MTQRRTVRKKNIIILIFLLSQALTGYSQFKKRKQIEYAGFFDSYFFRGPFNYYISTGTFAYFGDLCGSVGCNKLKPSIGFGANYNMWPRVLLGAEFQYFNMESGDENVTRNLGFKSKNCEFQAYARFEIIYNRILKHSERTKKPKLIKPYFLLGTSMVRYKAETFSIGPGSGDTLAKENVKFPRWSFTIPTGLGFKFSFSRRVALSIQANYRITFTDYLDEVSELRGSTDRKDAYASMNVMLEFTPGAKPYKKKPKKVHRGNDDETNGTSEPTPGKDSRWIDTPEEEETPSQESEDEVDTPTDADETEEATPEEEPEDTPEEDEEEYSDDFEDAGDDEGYEEWDDSDDSDDSEDDDSGW